MLGVGSWVRISFECEVSLTEPPTALAFLGAYPSVLVKLNIALTAVRKYIYHIHSLIYLFSYVLGNAQRVVWARHKKKHFAPRKCIGSKTDGACEAIQNAFLKSLSWQASKGAFTLDHNIKGELWHIERSTLWKRLEKGSKSRTS